MLCPIPYRATIRNKEETTGRKYNGMPYWVAVINITHVFQVSCKYGEYAVERK